MTEAVMPGAAEAVPQVTKTPYGELCAAAFDAYGVTTDKRTAENYEIVVANAPVHTLSEDGVAVPTGERRLTGFAIPRTVRVPNSPQEYTFDPHTGHTIHPDADTRNLKLLDGGQWSLFGPTAVLSGVVRVGRECTIAGMLEGIKQEVTIGSEVVTAAGSAVHAGTTVGRRSVIEERATVSPNADLEPGVHMEAGSSVGILATVGANTRLGRQASVGHGATVGADVHLGAESSVGSNTRIGNYTKLLEGARADANATIGNSVVLGEFSEVYGSATVEDDVSTGRRADVRNRAVVSSGSVLGDEVTVAEGVTVGARSHVLSGTVQRSLAPRSVAFRKDDYDKIVKL